MRSAIVRTNLDKLIRTRRWALREAIVIRDRGIQNTYKARLRRRYALVLFS